MKTSVDQYCINVTDLEKSVHFYETVLGLEATHRIETPGFTEVVLQGATGGRIQLARHHDQKGPIEHGTGFWKLYLNTDDCQGLVSALHGRGGRVDLGAGAAQGLARHRRLRQVTPTATRSKFSSTTDRLPRSAVPAETRNPARGLDQGIPSAAASAHRRTASRRRGKPWSSPWREAASHGATGSFYASR